MEKLERLLTELEYGLAYTITFVESDGREKCYYLWFEKEDTAYCLQEIHIENGMPEELGEICRYHKVGIIGKLTEFVECERFVVREWLTGAEEI